MNYFFLLEGLHFSPTYDTMTFPESESSPEYQTLLEHTAALVDTITSPDAIADHLLGKKIITMELYENVVSIATNQGKNRKLMPALMNYVKTNPEGFEVFLAILEGQQIYKALIKKLQSTYGELYIL